MGPTMRAFLMLMAAVAALVLTLAPPAHAAAPPDASPPTMHADQLAWRRFAQLVSPAGPHRVEYETWASDADIFTATPAWPGAAALEQKLLRPVARQPAFKRVALAPHYHAVADRCASAPQPGQHPCVASELRRNKASYHYIVRNGLHRHAALGIDTPALRRAAPADAAEVEAHWVPVDTLISWLARSGVRLKPSQVRARYYTTVAQGTSLALVSLHLSAKAAPHWVHASFEHRSNPGRCDSTGCHDRFGASVARVAPATAANQQYPACEQSAALKQLFASMRLADVWSHYCLKSSETDFAARAIAAVRIAQL